MHSVSNAARWLSRFVLLTTLGLGAVGCETLNPFSRPPAPEDLPATETPVEDSAPAESDPAAAPDPAAEPAPAESEPADDLPNFGEPASEAPEADPNATAESDLPNLADATQSPELNQETTERLQAIAGFSDPESVAEFLGDLQAAAAAGDRAALVNSVDYPLTMYVDGVVQATYENPQALLNDFDAVFTPAVLEAIANTDYAELFVNADGAMLGDGEIWLTPTDMGAKIYAVNPRT